MATPEATAEAVKEMKEVIETLKNQVLELNTRLMKAEDEVKTTKVKMMDEIGGMKDEKNKPKDIRGFDVKFMPKPDPYDGKPQNFPNWNELFIAHFAAMDDKWEAIFKELQQAKVTPNDIIGMKKLLAKASVREDEIPKANRMMYVSLLQYTTGEARGKVMSNGPSNAMDSYKYIYEKGTNATVMNILAVKTKAMHPEQAVDMNDVENKINKWKEDLRYLRETGNYDFTEEQAKGILVTILPDELQDHIIKKYTEFIDEDQVEQEIYVVIRRHQEKAKNKKAIGIVTDTNEDMATTTAYYWDENFGGFLAMAVPAQKRRRTEEEGEEPAEEESENPGKGPAIPSKGKGKGSPKTGCFNCGGNHYASQCPMKGKDKGGKAAKGKGGKEWFTQSRWNSYYPGPSPQTWSSWYPYGGKAKGKGKKGVRAVNEYP